MRAVLLLLASWLVSCDTPCPDDFRDASTFPLTCRCETLEDGSTVYGTQRYTEHSPICKSAAHAGVLRAPGEVTVYSYGECPLFTGRVRSQGASFDSDVPGPGFGFWPEPPACDDPFSIEPLNIQPPPDSATCDSAEQVEAICAAVAGEYDQLEVLEAVKGARFDCACEAVWSTNSGLRSVLPEVVRPRERFASTDLSPLERAVGSGHERQVRFLLEHGAPPDGPSHQRPLQVAVSSSRLYPLQRTRLVALLVAAGASREGLDFSHCRDGTSEQTSCAHLRRWLQAPR